MSDLDHPKVAPFTQDVARGLQIEPSFVDFVFAVERPVCFQYWCESVDGGWTCFVPDEIDIAYPLWSCNADQTLLLLSHGNISFGKGYHDAADMEMISGTSQGLLADLINLLYESETPEEEILLAAEFCGFRFLTDYFTFIKEPIPYETDREKRWSAFVRSIDANN